MAARSRRFGAGWGGASCSIPAHDPQDTSMRLPERESRHFIELYSALIGWCAGRIDPNGKI